LGLVLAVPVAPTQAIAALRRDVDDLVCLEAHEHFRAIGLHYDDFRQVSDDEVRLLLSRHQAAGAASSP
jgi:putative phosphoribosyl transferase